METESNILQARLKNCLLTIVELEPLLSKLTIHSELLSEFKHLKEIISKVSQLELSTDEVDRIENATTLFLKELELPLSSLRGKDDRSLQ
ncbi:hypothetical protein [Desulfonatronovibrio hydrogenovorans]|uniref:hypothetical protein n=1 Tax=Desulfonatronovibrio hydrogenovorans TaxID=53245 RepID=UPI000491182E|nr:hypothetical protein [Desulfonatronovibrio hydrogenovorans]